MKKITICDNIINIHDGVLGLSHSGGADSSLLLYLLMMNFDGPLHVYTCASKQKNRITPHVALDVIDKCMEITGKKNVYHHTYFVDIQTFDTLFNHLKQEINDSKIDFLYTGITNNPPSEILSTFRTKNGLENIRNPNYIKDNYKGKFYMPFININKNQIAEMYKYLGIIETIFPITRSCEDLILRQGHCGTCWWCEERQWAFEKLS